MARGYSKSTYDAAARPSSTSGVASASSSSARAAAASPTRSAARPSSTCWVAAIVRSFHRTLDPADRRLHARRKEVAMKPWAAPDGVPVLSRGKHRSPRRGACFMEFASFLAGEPWSDHPPCTHPLLAQVARQVNDLIGDEGRQELVPLIPLVVGRRGNDRTWLTLPVAVAAAPILDVPEATQRVLAAGLSSACQVSAEAGPHL